MSRLKKYFVCLAPFWFYIFDLVLMAAGIKYTGLEDSNLLVVVGLFVLGGIGLIYLSRLLRTQRMSMTELLLFAVIVLFILLYVITGIRLWGRPMALFSYIRKSVLYCLIGVLSVVIIHNEGWFDDFFKVTRWFAIAATIIVSYRMLPQLLAGFRGIEYYGSLRYQSMGYRCAIFGVLMEVYLWACKKRGGRLLYAAGIAANVLALLATGARGAVIAFALVSIFVILASIQRLTVDLILRYLGIGLAAFAVAAIAVFSIPTLREMFMGLETSRSFNFITDSGIDLDNRTSVFAQAIDLIRQSPIIGHGFGASYYYMGIHPHNLFFEFMVDGGLLYTAIIVLFIALRMKQWISCFRAHMEVRALFVVILVNLSMLLLSSSYYTNALFWLFLLFNPNQAFVGEETSQYTSAGHRLQRKSVGK